MGRHVEWEEKVPQYSHAYKYKRVPKLDMWIPWHTPHGAPAFICEDTRLRPYGKDLRGQAECWSHDAPLAWVRYGRRSLGKQDDRASKSAAYASGFAKRAREAARSRVGAVSSSLCGRGVDSLHTGAGSSGPPKEGGEVSLLQEPRTVEVAEVLGGVTHGL